jgi:hypothetical protein
MKQIIDGKLYDTTKARLVASDDYFDGNTYMRDGRNAHLYLTPRGNYFVCYTTVRAGERNYIEPITLKYAKEIYEQLSVHHMEYTLAFGEPPEEA